MTVPRPLWDRVIEKIDCVRNLDPDRCWLWTGATVRSRHSENRYPVIRDVTVRSGQHVVTRLMLIWFKGDAGPGYEAGHACPARPINTRCVNPRHLQWVTRQENERMKRAQREEPTPCTGS